MKKSVKLLLQIVLIVVAGLALTFGIIYSIREQKKRDIIVELQKIEDKASDMLAGIEKRASVWSVNVETIEDSLNKLLEEYPNTEAAGKVEVFRIEYPTTLKAAIEAH